MVSNTAAEFKASIKLFWKFGTQRMRLARIFSSALGQVFNFLQIETRRRWSGTWRDEKTPGNESEGHVHRKSLCKAKIILFVFWKTSYQTLNIEAAALRRYVPLMMNWNKITRGTPVAHFAMQKLRRGRTGIFLFTWRQTVHYLQIRIRIAIFDKGWDNVFPNWVTFS